LWPTFQRFWRTGALGFAQLAHTPAVLSLLCRAPPPRRVWLEVI
jgi:hypothetical protein